MALLPGGILPWIEARFLLVTSDGLVPNAGGMLKSYIAGTTTPQATYSDVNLTTANPVEIDLDADGRPPDPIYLAPTGYKFEVYDVDGVLQYTYDNVEDIGQTFATQFGYLQTIGAKNVTSGYTVVASDRLVTVASSGGPTPCIVNLPAASAYVGLLTIKNLGLIALAVTPSGLETIETLAAAYTVPVAASPQFPSIVMASDGVSAWWILADHRV